LGEHQFFGIKNLKIDFFDRESKYFPTFSTQKTLQYFHTGTGTGADRHRPALAGLDRHKTVTDRPWLFYDVFDKNFVLNSPNRHEILKILIKNVIK
jgi:hypothetical protein